jgi:hypothetical protein
MDGQVRGTRCRCDAPTFDGSYGPRMKLASCMERLGTGM